MYLASEYVGRIVHDLLWALVDAALVIVAFALCDYRAVSC